MINIRVNNEKLYYSLKMFSLRLSSILVFLFVWYLIGYSMPRYIVPLPHDILYAFIDLILYKNLLYNLALSFMRVLAGYFLGILVGIVVSTIALLFNTVREVLYPIIAFITVTPSFAFIPLLMIWIGLNDLLPIAVVVICVSFPIIYAMVSGLKNIERSYIDAAIVCGASNKDIVLRIILPLSITHIASLLKLEAGHGWRLVFVTEYLALTSGLGGLMIYAYSALRVDEVVALIMIVGLSAYVLQRFIEYIETSILKQWKYKL